MNFKGRVSRKQFIHGIFINGIIITILHLIWRASTGRFDPALIDSLFFGAAWIYVILVLVIKRMHDIDVKPLPWLIWVAFGNCLLIGLVLLNFVYPLVRVFSAFGESLVNMVVASFVIIAAGFVVIISLVAGYGGNVLVMEKGTDGENRYGPDPLSEGSGMDS